jgi:uncharacterized protein
MRNAAKFVTLQLLRGYKWAISPMFPPACRYVPTCSEYAIEAVDRYGALRGGLMAIWRLLRCHPFVRGGFDPVVKKKSEVEMEEAMSSRASAFCEAKDPGAQHPKENAGLSVAASGLRTVSS